MIQEEERLNAKILIVDDQKQNVLLMQTILKNSGYSNVQSTTDPTEGLKIFERFEPDLILLDLVMPKMNGFQVMEEIQAMNPDDYPPILVLTAEATPEKRNKALNLGALDFLKKPIDILEVKSRIKNMLNTRILYNKVRNQNVVLEDKVKERTRKIAKTQLEVINRLGRASEYRDNETGQHVVRMSYFCRAICKALGYSDSASEKMFYAAPMHDVGKIGIPDGILLKPAKLDQDEWETMKTHAQIGAEILSGNNSELLQLAESIALTHHEKWDGSGYPLGLSGKDIPMEGRIIAVCDVFDALTSERPYKNAWTIEETMEEMRNQSGIHFDPHLIKIFESILPEIIEIKNKYSEKLEHAPDIFDETPEQLLESLAHIGD